MLICFPLPNWKFHTLTSAVALIFLPFPQQRTNNIKRTQTDIYKPKANQEMRSTGHLTLLYTLIIVFFGTLTTFSQTDTSTSQDTTAVGPKAIPVISVISEMEAARQSIDDADVQLAPRKSLVNIDSLLPLYSTLIEERQTKARNLVNSNPGRQEVDNYIVAWKSYRSYLRAWMTSINTYLTRLSILEEDIAIRSQIWNLTSEAAIEREAPERILSSIQEIRSELVRITQSIGSQNNHYLQLESEINEQIVIVNNVIAELEVLRDSEVFDLFHLRNEPIWKTSSIKEEAEQTEPISSETFDENLVAIGEMLSSGENTIYIFILLLLITTGIVLLVRKSFLSYEFQAATKRLEYARDVIVNQPALVIFFVSVFIFWYLFTNTPRLFDDVIVLILLLTGAIMIKSYLNPKFKNVPYWIIFVVLIHNLKTYILLSTLQFRLYSLVEAILILALVIYFIRPYNQVKQLPLGKVSKILLSLTPLLYLFAIAAIISNLLGYTNLTAFALRACTQGCDLSLIFLTIVIVADAIVVGLIHHRFRRQSIIDPIKKMDQERKVSRFISVAAWILWLYYFLATIDLYRPISEALERFLSVPHKVGSITFTLGMLVTFIVILAISFAITSFISFLLDGKEARFNLISLPKGIPSAISMVFRYFILAVGFVLAISSLGIELSKFNLLAGALGLGIGFGLQTIVSNFISGIILVFERPILPGDVVEVNNLLGTVNKIGVRASRINTFDGSEVVVPNNNLISNDLINWTLSNNIRRLEILVGTSYDADPNIVLEALKEVANSNDLVLKNPSPLALFVEFGESSLNFRLLIWINIQNVLAARSEVSVAIYNRFKELGIRIPYPQRVVHLPKESE